ncbi:hypothetical protein GCM10022262_42070 [Georgenia daeguensis]|uniref:HNH endonuclease n=1 Tax=Georgenia daeguensis TaxID=908355 RepID=A0ABP6UN58_9MICO
MGGQHRAAAYLWFQKDLGDSFSMRELREALGEGMQPEDAEHLNRRLRQLRKHGWRFDSYKDRQGQPTDSYLLVEKGARTWLGERRQPDGVSAGVRRQVLDRDGNRCVVCGVGAGEPYPEDPDSYARMTIGHRQAGARLADAGPDNLQTECARCNEPSGDVIPDPETSAAVMASVRRLGAKDRSALLSWLETGRRQRSPLDLVYDRVRRLSESERAAVAERLREGL